MVGVPLARRLFLGFAAILLLVMLLVMAFSLIGLDGAVGSVVGEAHAGAVVSILQSRMMEGVVVAVLLALPVMFYLSRRMTSRLTWLAEGTERLVAGEDVVSLPTLATGEVGRLARSVRQLEAMAHGRDSTLSLDRDRLAAVLAAMVEGVVAVDGEEAVVHMNHAALRILRHEGQNPVGRKVWEVTRVLAVRQALQQAMATSRPFTGEARMVEGAGEQLLQLHAAPLHSGGGSSSGAVVVLHDITEMRRLEGVRRDFVANVSHELKTPVTAIAAMVEVLQHDGGGDGAAGSKFLPRIQNQCHRLKAMVGDLLALSRLESTDLRSEFQMIDLRRTLGEAVSGLQAVAERRQIQVQTDCPQEALNLLGDEVALGRMFGNLLENAIKYTAAGGTVSLRAHRRGEELVVEVQDEGIGIDRRHHSRIFERFYRVDKGRSRDVGGTGLGLSIVKHVVLAHEGRISLRSAPGEGSTFQVVLPAQASS